MAANSRGLGVRSTIELMHQRRLCDIILRLSLRNLLFSVTLLNIQLDIIVICRKISFQPLKERAELDTAKSADLKVNRLKNIGMELSENDIKIINYGQQLVARPIVQNLESTFRTYLGADPTGPALIWECSGGA